MREVLGEKGPNEVTYSTLVHACVQQGELARARRILSWMGEDATRPRPNVWAYTSLMRGLLAPPLTPLGSADRAAAAAGKGRAAAETGAVQSAASLDAKAQAAAQLAEAIELLSEMLELRIKPTQVTTTTLLTACFDRGNTTAARQIAKILRREANATNDAALAHATDCAMIVGFCRPPPEREKSVGAAARDTRRAHGRPGPRRGAAGLSEGQARDRANLREALQLFVRMTTDERR